MKRETCKLCIVVFLIVFILFISIDYFDVHKSPGPTGKAGGGGGICGDVAWEYCTEPFQTCPGGASYPEGGACGLYELCCIISPYCGNRILEAGEQCDTNVGIATCASYGYYAGSVTCTSSCTEDTSGCSGSCGDGVCDDGYETCSSCVADCEGEQADCSSGQLCTNVMEVGSCVAPAPPVCNDTTALNTCSNVTGAPWYCNSSAILEENCTTCGCPIGSKCNSSGGNCVALIAVQLPQDANGDYAGTTYTIRDATVTLVGVSGATPIDKIATGSQYSWDKLRRKDKVLFEIAKIVPDVKEDSIGSSGASREEHTIQVDRVSRARKLVEITIYSEPLELTLYEGEPRRVDVDGDGVEDIVVLATNIGLSDFDIDIQEIDQEKLEEESIVDEMIVKLRERRVFFPEPLLSPVFEESPEANVYEFIIVNVVIFISMVFYFFKFAKAVKKK